MTIGKTSAPPNRQAPISSGWHTIRHVAICLSRGESMNLAVQGIEFLGVKTPNAVSSNCGTSSLV